MCRYFNVSVLNLKCGVLVPKWLEEFSCTSRSSKLVAVVVVVILGAGERERGGGRGLGGDVRQTVFF